MNPEKLHRIKDFSLLVIPNYSGIQTKSIKLRLGKIILFGSAFALVVFILTILLLAFTPLKYMLFAFDNNEIAVQSKKIEILNSRMIFLTRELENLSNLNNKLKYAIALGDSLLIDSLRKKQEEPSQKKEVNPFGGNILTAFRQLAASEQNNTRSSSVESFFIAPVKNAFMSRKYNSEKGHFGVDYAVKTGTPVLAAAGGFVVFADYTASDGYMMIIIHENEYITVYKHCSMLMKKLRDSVHQGELIALTGNTGLDTTGPHLHFEIWKSNQVIDPQTVLIN